MYIEIGAGEALHVGLRESDGVFIIDFAKSDSNVLSISADRPDATGREGLIYEDRLNDSASHPEQQLLSALEHGQDEDLSSQLLSMDRARAADDLKPVSHMERDRAEVQAIAKMLMVAETDEAVTVAAMRLARHVGWQPPE